MSIWSAVIPATASIIGAGIGVGGNLLGASASKKAAKKAAKLEEAKLAEATRQYNEIRTDAAPGVAYLRNLVAVPQNGLYPDQIAAQEEVRRQGLNDISHSGLRGSGRAVTAALKKIDSDFYNTAMAGNRNARQQAASQLAGPYFTAGSNIAQATLSGGQSQAASIADQGNTTANATLANSELVGKALGDISSLAASEIKGRDSRYSEDDLAKAFAKLAGGDEGKV